MELKLLHCCLHDDTNICSNRTFMELKYLTESLEFLEVLF